MIENLQEILDLVRDVQDRCKLLAMLPHLHQFYELAELPTVMCLIAESVTAGIDDPLFTSELRLTTLIAELTGPPPEICSGKNSSEAIATKVKA